MWIFFLSGFFPENFKKVFNKVFICCFFSWLFAGLVAPSEFFLQGCLRDIRAGFRSCLCGLLHLWGRNVEICLVCNCQCGKSTETINILQTMTVGWKEPWSWEHAMWSLQCELNFHCCGFKENSFICLVPSESRKQQVQNRRRFSMCRALILHQTVLGLRQVYHLIPTWDSTGFRGTDLAVATDAHVAWMEEDCDKISPETWKMLMFQALVVEISRLWGLLNDSWQFGWCLHCIPRSWSWSAGESFCAFCCSLDQSHWETSWCFDIVAEAILPLLNAEPSVKKPEYVTEDS